MKHPFSLSSRTLLLSFVCMCAVLAAGFLVLNATIRVTIKEGLKQNLQRTAQQLDQWEPTTTAATLSSSRYSARTRA